MWQQYKRTKWQFASNNQHSLANSETVNVLTPLSHLMSRSLSHPLTLKPEQTARTGTKTHDVQNSCTNPSHIPRRQPIPRKTADGIQRIFRPHKGFFSGVCPPMSNPIPTTGGRAAVALGEGASAGESSSGAGVTPTALGMGAEEFPGGPAAGASAGTPPSTGPGASCE